MKDKKFYFLLIGLALIGIGSVFFYRLREEQRALEVEGYEISAIADRVEALYNDEKIDLAQDISTEEMEDLALIFEDLDKKSLNRRNRERIRESQLDFLIAEAMVVTDNNIEAIFIQSNIVHRELSEEEIDALETEVLAFDRMPGYINRNIERLAYARQQVVARNRAIEFVDSLFDKENKVLKSVTREDEQEALSLIAAILNKKIKEELMMRMEQVDLRLTEREEQEALEESLRQEQMREQEREELEESNEVSPPGNTAPPVQEDENEEDLPEEEEVEEPIEEEPSEPTPPEEPGDSEDEDEETEVEDDLEDEAP